MAIPWYRYNGTMVCPNGHVLRVRIYTLARICTLGCRSWCDTRDRPVLCVADPKRECAEK